MASSMRVSTICALGHRLDDLALDEDLALAVAGGDSEVGLAGLARAVDDAAHDGHPQRHGQSLQAGGDLLGEGVDVDLGATARGAGDDLQLARLETQRLQDLVADLDLLDRRGRQRDPDRVADAAREQRAEGGGRLDGALEGRAGLGDAEVQRPVAALGEHLVGPDHDDRVVVLDRDLEVVEVVLLEQARLPDRRLDERLGCGLAVLLQQPLVQGPGVDPDPDRHAGGLGCGWRSA
jgi:hypothetical protein